MMFSMRPSPERMRSVSGEGLFLTENFETAVRHSGSGYGESVTFRLVSTASGSPSLVQTFYH